MAITATLLIDGHIHIYPHFDLTAAINQGVINLKRLAKNLATTTAPEKLIPMWLLTERHDCNFFKNLTNESLRDNLKIVPGIENETSIVEKNGEPILYIFAGRQLVTRENLEVLSLISTLFLKDREKAIPDVINHIIDSGGIPAINWAPGKWFFSRGKIVEEVIQNYSPKKLLIADTSLRTKVWPLPKLMVKAKSLGFKIIAGSDPLPFKNEDIQIGCYAFSVTGEFDKTKPAESLRKLLLNRHTEIQLIGNRNDMVTFFKRQFKIMMG